MPGPPHNSPQMVTESLEEHGEGSSSNKGKQGNGTSIKGREMSNVEGEKLLNSNLDKHYHQLNQQQQQHDIAGNGNGINGDALQRRSSGGRRGGGHRTRVPRESRRSNSDNGETAGSFFNPRGGPEFGRTYSYDETGGGRPGSGKTIYGGPVQMTVGAGVGHHHPFNQNGPPQATPAPFQSPPRVPSRHNPRDMHRRSTSEHFDYPPVYAQPPMLQPIIAGEELDASLPGQLPLLARRETGGGGRRTGSIVSYGAIGHGGDRRRYGSADDAKLFNSPSPRKASSERQFSARGELQNYAENFSPSRSTRTILHPGSSSPRSPQYHHLHSADYAAPSSPMGNNHSPLLTSHSMRNLPSPRMVGAYGPEPTMGGEMEPFLSQNFGRSHSGSQIGIGPGNLSRQESRRTQFRRRNHMRHHSAQLFMSNAKGAKQPKKCRDVIFAVFFLMQFIAMVIVAVYYGPAAIANAQETEDIDNNISSPSNADVIGDDDAYDMGNREAGTTVVVEYGHLLQLAIFCGLFACTLSGLSLFFMALFSKEVIKICLIGSIALSFAWGTIGIGLRPTSFVPITGVIVLALCVGYAFVVWTRIPFAAANLRTGLSGVKSRLGVAGIAYLFQVVALGCSIIWVLASLGVYDARIRGCSSSDSTTATMLSSWFCSSRYPYGVMVLFLASYLWTLQVCTYLVQVVVAGSIENWWSEKDETEGTETESDDHDDDNNNDNNDNSRTCCAEHLRDNFLNSMTFSFGSICYGSLLVGPVQTLRQLAEPLRPKDEPSLLFLNQLILPVQKLLFSWIDAAAIHCNQWAFVYLGMYRYGFMQSGKLATDLLETRGWSNIANDDLLGNVLYMFGFAIGGCTGCFAVVIQQIDHYQIASNSNQATLAFFAGLLIGLVLSNVLMSAVIGSVNAVIICFAENPWDFQMNHPQLCNEMNLAWSTVWPGCLTSSGGLSAGSSSNLLVDSASRRDLLHSSLRPWDMAV